MEPTNRMHQGCAATSPSVMRCAGSTVSIPLMRPLNFYVNREMQSEEYGSHLEVHKGCGSTDVPKILFRSRIERILDYLLWVRPMVYLVRAMRKFT